MYSPASEKRRVDDKGVEHVDRVYGLKQASFSSPSLTRHTTWNRDENAPINFIIAMQSVLATGSVPARFLHATTKESLLHPPATRYTYRCQPGRSAMKRSLKPPL